MNSVNYNLTFGESCNVNIEIPQLDSLEKHKVWRDEAILSQNKTEQRLNSFIPNSSGVYFLYYSDFRLLYIGKAVNIRQRLNQHTMPRTVREIVDEERMNPKHIVYASWLEAADAGARDVIETAYLQKHGTVWNNEKVNCELIRPAVPEDEDLELPEVKLYIKREQKIIDESVNAVGVS